MVQVLGQRTNKEEAQQKFSEVDQEVPISILLLGALARIFSMD